MKRYVHIVTVTVKAPKGYIPRSVKIKGAVLSDKASYKEKAEQRILEPVRETYEQEKYRKIGLKFQVESSTTMVELIMTDKDDEDMETVTGEEPVKE